jgi:beta-xylosidase
MIVADEENYDTVVFALNIALSLEEIEYQRASLSYNKDLMGEIRRRMDRLENAMKDLTHA